MIEKEKIKEEIYKISGCNKTFDENYYNIMLSKALESKSDRSLEV